MDKYPIKTIEQCKDEVAKQYCHINHEPFKDWPDLLLTCIVEKRLKQIDEATNKAIELYASQFQNPISSELPSDEEISNFAKEKVKYPISGIICAEWMRSIASDIISKKEQDIFDFAGWMLKKADPINYHNYKPINELYENYRHENNEYK